MQSTLELLEKNGYGPLTMEGIAAQAGVSKQTLYRWWPTKGAVIMDALIECFEPGFEPGEDHGSLRADLTHTVERLCNALQGTFATMMSGLMAEAQRDKDFAEVFRHAFVERRRATLHALLARAVARGEVRADLDTEIFADLIYGPMWYRLLTHHQPMDAKFCHQLCDVVLRAVCAP